MLMNRVLLLVITLFLSSVAHAQPTATRPAITKEKAAQLAQTRYPGKVIRVQTEADCYRIRVLQSNGRVITVLVDGQSGRVRRDEN